VLEREYSTPDIPTPWKRKISLTVTEAKKLINGVKEMINSMIDRKDSIIQLGVEFIPLREILNLSKNHYVVLTLLGDESVSLMFTNHWSWIRDTKEGKDEYATSLFIPATFVDEVMDEIIIRVL